VLIPKDVNFRLNKRRISHTHRHAHFHIRLNEAAIENASRASGLHRAELVLVATDVRGHLVVLASPSASLLVVHVHLVLQVTLPTAKINVGGEQEGNSKSRQSN